MLKTFQKDTFSVRVKKYRREIFYCLFDITHSLKLKNGRTIKSAIERAHKCELKKFKADGDEYSFLTQEQLEYFLRLYSTSADFNAFIREIPYWYKSQEAKETIVKESKVAEPQASVPSVVDNVGSINKVERATSLQVFNYGNSTLDYGILNGEPVFNLNYIGALLEIANPRMSIDISDKDYVVKIDNSVVSFTYNRNLNNRGELFLTEAGLYRLLLRSNKQEAEKFSKWVTKEVLPSIRKTDIGIKDSSKYLPQEVNSNCINVDVKLFNFEMFDVETLFENSTPYFRLTDIEKVLGLTKGQSAKWIKEGWFDDDEVKLRNSQLGGYPLKYVAESGLYRILNRTNSPKARPFERWVTKEVLPSLRKNGGYIAGQENMTPEQILANAMVVAQNIIDSQKQTIAYQGEKLNDYKAVEKVRRSKLELAKAINKNVKLLAEQKFNKQYANAYNYIYSIFASHHNISAPIDMPYLKKNNDYLEEVLRIVLAELD